MPFTSIGDEMRKFKAGGLHSGSSTGPIVTNPKQAIAISLSEARKAGQGRLAAPKRKPSGPRLAAGRMP
jgi:hypothetical protein